MRLLLFVFVFMFFFQFFPSLRKKNREKNSLFFLIFFISISNKTTTPISGLTEQVERMGADLSILRRQGGGDPSTSTAAASAPSASASALERRVAAHQTHVRRLDQILRLLSNYQVEPNGVDTQVRAAIEGYVARSEVALERSSSGQFF